MDDQILIKTSIIRIFNDNGYVDPAGMTQRDFDHIAEQLRQKSGILISGTTIKRLGYGEFSRLPQIATLNAIANYFNYKTWQDYKAEKTKPEPAIEPSKKVRPKFSLKYVSILSVVVVGASLYLFGTKRSTIGNAESATFSFRKNTSNDIPNTVAFSYNIDDVEADSFFIQQSWDANRRIRIYKKKYTVTDIYYEPGYHIAKLLANDSAIRAVDVSIPTNGWFFYSIDNKTNYTPEYIKSDNFVDDGSLGITMEQLLENGIDVKKDKRYHNVYFPDKINVPSDNFKFKSRVRMKELRGAGCPYIEIELYCQRYFMIMRSTTKGCAHEALLQFGEQVMRGTDTDLLPISFNVQEWTDVEITVKNKVVTISVNDKEVYSTRFFADTKNLAGLGFISNGICEVDEVELVGLDGEVVYKNDF